MNTNLGAQEAPHCPFCESSDVKLYAPFGTAQLVRQYYCSCCSSVFEFIRWQEPQSAETTEAKPK